MVKYLYFSMEWAKDVAIIFILRRDMHANVQYIY